jgi:cbb3-type cytochrome oxidase maturation protein
MSVMYVVLPLAIVLSAVAVAAFVWAVRRGQLDDTKTPAVRILYDEEQEEEAGEQPSRAGEVTSLERKSEGPSVGGT